MKNWQKVLICSAALLLLIAGMWFGYRQTRPPFKDNYIKVDNPDFEYGDTYIIDADDQADSYLH